jgi:xylulokinase
MMFLGIDIGTSGVKAIIVDESDREIASAVAPLAVQRPQPLWAEQDPEAWWGATCAALDALAAQGPERMGQVVAIGLSGQMLGVTLLDAADRPIRPALLWNDGRATAECAALREEVADFIDLTGASPMPGFPAPKLLWLARHEPQAIVRTRRVLLTKDYVRLRLTGEAVSDLADGSATLLMETEAGRWSARLAEVCGISTDHLPRLVESGAVGGVLRAELAQRWGLRAGIPIAGGGGDNMCGAVGAGVVRRGDAAISLGTSGVFFVANDRFVPARGQGMHTHRHAVSGLYGHNGCVLSAAAALAWIMEIVKADDATAFLAAIEAAALAPDAVPVFTPYLTGERTPYDDAAATATFSGLRIGMDAVHLGRAVLDGVAFALADCRDALAAAGAPIARLVLVGGGARSAYWARIIATVLGESLSIPAQAALGPALGAARLARQAVGGALVAGEAEEVVVEPRAGLRDACAAQRDVYRRHYAMLGRAK